MLLDKYTLDNLLVNRYLVVVTGQLTDQDRMILLKGLGLYSEKKHYVGQSHIEPFFCSELSNGLKAIYGINSDTSIMFFKNGFLECKLQGSNELLRNSENFFGIVIEKLGNYLV